MKELRLQITEELHRQFKQTALDEGLTLKRLMTEALEEYIERRKGEEHSGQQGRQPAR